MGCTSTKSKEQLKEQRKIGHKFEETKLQKFDDFFAKAVPIFQKTEEFRHALEDCPEEMIEATDVDALNPTGNLFEAFKVFCWALSATHEGDFKKSKLKFTEAHPFIEFEAEDGHPEFDEFAKPLQKFLKIMVEGKDKFEPLAKEAEELAKSAEDLIKTADDEIKNSTLDTGDKFKALGKVAGAGKLLADGAAKTAKIAVHLKDLAI